MVLHPWVSATRAGTHITVNSEFYSLCMHVIAEVLHACREPSRIPPENAICISMVIFPTIVDGYGFVTNIEVSILLHSISHLLIQIVVNAMIRMIHTIGLTPKN